MASLVLKCFASQLALAALPVFLGGCGSSTQSTSTTLTTSTKSTSTTSTTSMTTSPQAEPAPNTFVRYPGYSGSFDITDHGGSKFHAQIWFPGTVTLYWQLQGVPLQCTKPGSDANSCAIHISEGTTCLDASMVGDDFYDSSSMSSNPWIGLVYTATKVPGSTTPDEGEAHEQTQLDIGIPENKDIVGRAMVVYDFEGNRMACGLIGESTTPTTFPSSTTQATTTSSSTGPSTGPWDSSESMDIYM